MGEISYRHNEKCKFLVVGNGLGKVVKYTEFVTDYFSSREILARFIKELQDVVDIESYIVRQVFSNFDLGQSISNIFVDSVNIIHKKEFLNQFENGVFNEKVDVRKVFLKVFTSNKSDVLDKVYKYTQKSDIENILEFTKKRIFSLINKLLIQDLTHKIKDNFIFVTDDFQVEIFDDISMHLKGIICTKDYKIGVPNAYAIDFGIPLVICKQPLVNNQYLLIDGDNKNIILDPSDEHKSQHLKVLSDKMDINFEDLIFKNPKFRIFASTVDTLSIDTISKSNNYHGICSFRSEYYYATRGIAPNLKEQTEKFIDIIQKMGDKEIFFEIPHFDHNIKMDIMGDDVTDLKGVEKYGEIFETYFDSVAAASASTNRQINIVIPMLMSSNEVDEWLMHIEYHFSSIGAPKPNIGGALESEGAIMHGTNFGKLDFIVIGLDDLYDEIDDDYDKLKNNAHIEMINPVSMDDLRRLHKLLQRLKRNQRHILHGNVLTNPQILHIFLKRGFKEFAIPVNKMHLVYDVFKNHLESVGKYVGYRAMIKAKKLAKLSESDSNDDDNNENE